jgi:hypothetical protein
MFKPFRELLSINNPVNRRCWERDEVRVAVHERNVLTIGGHIHCIFAQENTESLRFVGPQENRRPFEMPITTVEHETFIQLKELSIPEIDDGIGSLDSLPVVDMQINWCIAKRMTPLNHTSNQMRMRHCKS